MNAEEASKLKAGDRVRISLLGKTERTLKSVEYVEGATLQKRYEITVEAVVGTKKTKIPYHHAYVYPANE